MYCERIHKEYTINTPQIAENTLVGWKDASTRASAMSVGRLNGQSAGPGWLQGGAEGRARRLAFNSATRSECLTRARAQQPDECVAVLRSVPASAGRKHGQQPL